MNLRAVEHKVGKKKDEISYEELRKRRGRVMITRELLVSNPMAVMKIMRNCIVIRCEYLYDRDIFDYYAISPLFLECYEGAECPSYTLNQDGTLCK